jgi:hypothetical protein
MVFDYAAEIMSDTVLFEDVFTTFLSIPGVKLRKSTEADKGQIFEHEREPPGNWVLEADHGIVATGGILFHYNVPYGDIFMEVDRSFRQRGYGYKN